MWAWPGLLSGVGGCPGSCAPAPRSLPPLRQPQPWLAHNPGLIQALEVCARKPGPRFSPPEAPRRWPKASELKFTSSPTAVPLPLIPPVILDTFSRAALPSQKSVLLTDALPPEQTCPPSLWARVSAVIHLNEMVMKGLIEAKAGSQRCYWQYPCSY